ncbi:MAG: S8 family serine peptidase, partial [Planctomycetes bacterium]|nr:S8 family serine peptidase [Planctomycetota bacterium]
WDFFNNDNDPYDDHYHGTHCAGTIAAVGNNGIGLAGVCWSAKIMALKFLSSDGRGSTTGAIRAVEYAIMMGVKLTSNSWSGGGYSQALYRVIQAAGDTGQLFIAAAGNSGADNDATPRYPSSYNLDNIIAVAATDRYDNRSSFSCYGATSVDLGAPGSSIYSTMPGNSYGNLNGTSMATPHVSGAAALIWSQYPAMSYNAVKERIMDTVDPLVALDGLTVTGGRLNVYEALIRDQYFTKM